MVKIELAGHDKVGIVLFAISIAAIISVAYFYPNIIAFFGSKTIVEGNVYTNIVVRLYMGFLISTALMFAAQFILWTLAKLSLVDIEEYGPYSGKIVLVRNFNSYSLLILFALVFLISGQTMARI